MADIEAGGFVAADFGELEMRVLSQVHDEMILGVDPGASNDQIDALKYTFAQMAQASRDVAKKQMKAYRQFFGGPQHFAKLSLSDEQRRWADAFEIVLGVGEHFYVKADAERKRWLEQHYTTLSSHDTSKGRKAAKVVAYRVAAAIADADRPAKEAAKINRVIGMPYRGSVTGTGRLTGLHNLPRMRGNNFGHVIIDELTEFKRAPTNVENSARKADSGSLDDQCAPGPLV